MTEVFTEAQTLTRVSRLTETRLTAYIEAGAVRPAQAETGPVFEPVDLARLELLSDFAELYDMEPEALAVVIAIIDQLHAARRDRNALLNAIRAETREVQERVAFALARARRRTEP
jgi:chaperone modulatory protein CbpM